MEERASVLPPAYLLNTFDFVLVGNRTSKTLSVTFDGKSWPLPPYPEVVAVPRPVAEWAARQHRVNGTENPWNPVDVESLIYVKSAKGELKFGSDTPREQSDAIESLDRSMLPPDRQTVTELNFGVRVADRITLPPAQPPERGGSAAFFDGRE